MRIEIDDELVAAVARHKAAEQAYDAAQKATEAASADLKRAGQELTAAAIAVGAAWHRIGEQIYEQLGLVPVVEVRGG